METARIDVQGMTCGGCVASVTRVVKALPGVANVDVTLDPGRATVTYDAALLRSRRCSRHAEKNGGPISPESVAVRP